MLFFKFVLKNIYMLIAMLKLIRTVFTKRLYRFQPIDMYTIVFNKLTFRVLFLKYYFCLCDKIFFLFLFE